MYEIFVQLLQEKGISAYRLSKDTGISTASLTDWKKGRTTPKVDKLQKIADYFGVDLNYLLGISPCRNTRETAKIKEEHSGLSDAPAIGNKRLLFALKDVDKLPLEDIDRIVDYINLIKDRRKK